LYVFVFCFLTQLGTGGDGSNISISAEFEGERPSGSSGLDKMKGD